MPGEAKCRECGAPMIWATMPSGKPNPLDAEPVAEVAAKMGQFALNPQTGHAVPVMAGNLLDVAVWMTRGVTVHLSHWATCPEREKIRRETDARRAEA